VIGGFLLSSFAGSMVTIVFLRSAAISRQEDDEMDELLLSQQRRDRARRARWIARSTHIPDEGTDRTVA